MTTAPYLVPDHNTIIATDVSEADYMRLYAGQFCEWINGTVIKMSPVHAKHDKLSQYLAMLLNSYLEHRPIGELHQEPFSMRLEYKNEQGEDVVTRREPDLQLILNDNPNKLTPTFMDGASDIVIEIVSPESQQRDYADKLYMYERGGVPEYWIINPIKKEARFYMLNARQAYVLQDDDGETYTTSRLPNFILNIQTLWQAELPKPSAIVKAVAEMLED